MTLVISLMNTLVLVLSSTILKLSIVFFGVITVVPSAFFLTVTSFQSLHLFQSQASAAASSNSFLVCPASSQSVTSLLSPSSSIPGNVTILNVVTTVLKLFQQLSLNFLPAAPVSPINTIFAPLSCS